MKNILEKYGIINRKGPIRAFWFKDKSTSNFGDLVTPYLIKKMTGEAPLLCNRFCLAEYYIMTGSVIEHANRNAIIWGTGMIRRNQKIKRPKKIHAVRGPITRKRLIELGYECPEVYGDPALLLPKFYRPEINKKYEIGVIPHFIDYKRVKDRIQSDKVLVIDLLNSVENVVDQILSCQKTLSSSLHGIIVSQAYDIPSVWVRFSNELSGDDTKFRDYFLSVGIDPYDGIDLRDADLRQELLKKCLMDARADINIDLDTLLRVCPIAKGRERGY